MATPDKNALVVELNNLEFGYDKPILRIAHFALKIRESVAVFGPSGCGKTTLMHLIAGLLRPQKGTVKINGTDITALSEAFVDRVRGQNIGIVFQQLHLIPSISVIDNLLLGQRLARVPTDRPFAMELLAQLGLAHLIDQMPAKLSQGESQRVAIARAVAHRPSLLIADEPTSALDRANADDALGVLREITYTNAAALIIVTHDERVRDSIDRVFDLGAKA
ncbi:MAG: putative ABC transport system ATP-binding protein [Candidatus Azotimanducaceae bacterium]|jgi:ABC-type lipoprotein export system ATPase subunit